MAGALGGRVPHSRRPLTGPQLRAAQEVALVLRVADVARSYGRPALGRELDLLAGDLRSRREPLTLRQPSAP